MHTAVCFRAKTDGAAKADEHYIFQKIRSGMGINMGVDSTEKITGEINNGRTVLGIEFGSTRIKAVLNDSANVPIASGAFDWENRLENGWWTYSMDEINNGLAKCYASLADDVMNKYGTTLTKIGAIGISAMMHGYLVFDKNGKQLVPFRTWRNDRQEKASNDLTELLKFHIPQRWSIAHLYQAILGGEDHVKDISFMTTLAGYVHYELTGKRVIGIGDASGMFPIDTKVKDFDQARLDKFDSSIADHSYPWKIRDILPKVLTAGENAGELTADGAKLLDRSGKLSAGIPMCPPEGDAGTGMAATDSTRQRTGNVSAGTSVFAMVVLEKPLGAVHDEIDIVTTPSGSDAAMVHCNNCTSDINAWVSVLRESAELFGAKPDMNETYEKLFGIAMQGDDDCGGLLSYNYLSGEHITGFEEGRPLLARTPESNFTLANLMRVNLYTSLGALKSGMDILFGDEHVGMDRITGHGGFFKTKGVGQKIMADALKVPVTVMKTAGEGGAWGIALLASYMIYGKEGQSLDDFLDNDVFAGMEGETIEPDDKEADGFDRFMKRYNSCLSIERAAVENLKAEV